MKKGPMTQERRERAAGFSLIELLIVVGIIVVLAAVSLPNIGQYIRNYKIKGATSQVSAELQAARTKAIMTNSNLGVSFLIVDADSYRWIREDAPAGEQLGSLRDLPVGVRFQVAGGAAPAPGVRFSRLGALRPGLFGGAVCTTAEAARCGTDSGLDYIDTSAGANITLVETVTNMTRTVQVAPGGRVLAQP